MNNNIVILNFHGIGNPPRNASQGEKDVWAKERLFIDCIDFVASKTNMVVTFDDGNISDYSIAFPMLQKYEITGYFFVIAGLIDKKGYCSQKDLREMRKHGMIIGNHGMGHKSWRGLSDEEYAVELHDARKKIEDIIDAPVLYAACPFGSYDGTVIKKLKQYNYLNGYTSDRGMANKRDFMQSRFSVHYNDTIESITNEIESYQKSHIKQTKRKIKSLLKSLR